MVHGLVQRWPWGKEKQGIKGGWLKLVQSLFPAHGAQSDPGVNVVVVLDDVVVVVAVVVEVVAVGVVVVVPNGVQTNFGLLRVTVLAPN